MNPNNYGQQGQQGYGQPGMGIQGQTGLIQPGMGVQGHTGCGQQGMGVQGQTVCGQQGTGIQGQQGNLQKNIGLTCQQEFNRPNYQQMNLQNHQLRNYNFNKDIVKKQSDVVFQQFSQGRNFVYPNEVPNMVTAFTEQSNLPQVNQQDIFFILSQIDDRDGKIEKDEFKLLLKILSGHKKMDNIYKHKKKHHH